MPKNNTSGFLLHHRLSWQRTAVAPDWILNQNGRDNSPISCWRKNIRKSLSTDLIQWTLMKYLFCSIYETYIINLSTPNPHPTEQCNLSNYHQYRNHLFGDSFCAPIYHLGHPPGIYYNFHILASEVYNAALSHDSGKQSALILIRDE